MQVNVLPATQPVDRLSGKLAVDRPADGLERLGVGRLDTDFELEQTRPELIQKVKHWLGKAIRGNFKMKKRRWVSVFQILPNCQGPVRIVVEGPVNETNRFRVMQQDIVEFAEDLIEIGLEKVTSKLSTIRCG